MDILIDDNNELTAYNGDFSFGDPDAQNVAVIIQANKGNFLENPSIGVGIDRYRNGNISLNELEKNIRLELTKDGFDLRSLKVSPQGEITLDAKRIR